MKLRRSVLLLSAVLIPSGCARIPAEPVLPPPPAPATETPTDGGDDGEAGAWHLLDFSRDGVVGAAVEEAYRGPLAGGTPRKTILVAVIDSGIDTTHVDLREQLWRNPDEVPGNGLDDDGNGLVDDVRGWNFLGSAEGGMIHHDTYEITRLHARCLAATEDGTRAALAAVPGVRDGCDGIRSDFEDKRAETEAIAGQIRSISEALSRALPVLAQATGRPEPTEEEVRRLRPDRSEVAQAREIFLFLAEQGITPAELEAAREAYDDQLRYGLDPTFRPREDADGFGQPSAPLLTGNTDVAGPDPSHGTHVAGIIAATRGNGIGIDGIAAEVRIMAIRAVPDGDERDADVARAIRYAVEEGAHIINMSFGKGYSPGKGLVDDAVRAAEAAGVLLIHAAGNDGADLDTEASFPSARFLDGGEARLWIEVGASGPEPDALAAPFSNWGKGRVDLFAPGMEIRSTMPGDAYEPQDGTSMAAPVVAGVAALLMSHFPELDAAEIRDILIGSARSFGEREVPRPGGEDRIRFGDLSRSGAVVDARAAVLAAQERMRERAGR